MLLFIEFGYYQHNFAIYRIRSQNTEQVAIGQPTEHKELKLCNDDETETKLRMHILISEVIYQFSRDNGTKIHTYMLQIALSVFEI